MIDQKRIIKELHNLTLSREDAKRQLDRLKTRLQNHISNIVEKIKRYEEQECLWKQRLVDLHLYHQTAAEGNSPRRQFDILYNATDRIVKFNFYGGGNHRDLNTHGDSHKVNGFGTVAKTVMVRGHRALLIGTSIGNIVVTEDDDCIRVDGPLGITELLDTTCTFKQHLCSLDDMFFLFGKPFEDIPNIGKNKALWNNNRKLRARISKEYGVIMYNYPHYIPGQLLIRDTDYTKMVKYLGEGLYNSTFEGVEVLVTADTPDKSILGVRSDLWQRDLFTAFNKRQR